MFIYTFRLEASISKIAKILCFRIAIFQTENIEARRRGGGGGEPKYEVSNKRKKINSQIFSSKCFNPFVNLNRLKQSGNATDR